MWSHSRGLAPPGCWRSPTRTPRGGQGTFCFQSKVGICGPEIVGLRGLRLTRSGSCSSLLIFILRRCLAGTLHVYPHFRVGGTETENAHSSQLGTLPRDVGGPSDLTGQSNLIYGQQVVPGPSNDAPLPPRGLPGNRVLFVAAESPGPCLVYVLQQG